MPVGHFGGGWNFLAWIQGHFQNPGMAPGGPRALFWGEGTQPSSGFPSGLGAPLPPVAKFPECFPVPGIAPSALLERFYVVITGGC